MNSLEERLKAARTYLGFTQDEMANALGAKKRGYQENENGKTKPRADIIAGFVKLGINANWLLVGEGEMSLRSSIDLVPNPDTISVENSIKQPLNAELTADIIGSADIDMIKKAVEKLQYTSLKTVVDKFEEEYVLVPGYHVQVSTGHGAFPFDEGVKRHLAFRRKYLNYRKCKDNQLAVVFSRGDSMEPTIKDNDSLLIDLSCVQPVDGKIFVVRLGDDLYAKRVQCLVNGGLTLISDNKEYPPQTIAPEDLSSLKIIGQVIWIGKDV